MGLRGLVDQVYRQIHHKVNREDIKKLISAKYVNTNTYDDGVICCVFISGGAGST